MKIEKYLPNLLTFANLFCGFLGIVSCLNESYFYWPPNDPYAINAMGGNIVFAGFLVFLGAFFDLFDGMAARWVKSTSPIGKELDSLTDMVTFGVLPALILYDLLLHSHTWWLYSAYIGYTPLGMLLPFLLTAGAAWRLAKFNTDATQSKTFSGLPTPACAMFFASFPLIMRYSDVLIFKFDVVYISNIILNPLFLIPLILLFSWLMVSKIRLFSLKLNGFSYKNNRFAFNFAAACILIFIIFRWVGVPLIIMLFIILSIVRKKNLKHGLDGLNDFTEKKE